MGKVGGEGGKGTVKRKEGRAEDDDDDIARSLAWQWSIIGRSMVDCGRVVMAGGEARVHSMAPRPCTVYGRRRSFASTKHDQDGEEKKEGAIIEIPLLPPTDSEEGRGKKRDMAKKYDRRAKLGIVRGRRRCWTFPK